MVSVIVGVAIAALSVPDGTVRRGLGALRRELPAFLVAAVATAILCFTRFLSYPPGIAGVGETLGAWWRLLTESSGQPATLFLMVLLVYEPIAVVFAIAAVVRDRSDRGDALALFAGWWVAAFALWSFSAGREPEHAVHVALPLVLLGGIGLGNILHAIDWRYVWHGNGGLLALLMLGIVVGLAAVGVLLTRVDDQGGGPAAALPPVAVLCLVVVPLAYLVWRITGDDAAGETGSERQPVLIALLVAALLLGAFGLRSANLLAFSRADLGTELLAQRTATLGTLPSIERFLRLARDVGVNDGSARDPTGSHSLSIALERDVQWPYVWYFREFPDLTVVAPGTAATTGAQVAIAARRRGSGRGRVRDRVLALADDGPAAIPRSRHGGDPARAGQSDPLARRLALPPLPRRRPAPARGDGRGWTDAGAGGAGHARDRAVQPERPSRTGDRAGTVQGPDRRRRGRGWRHRRRRQRQRPGAALRPRRQVPRRLG